MLSKLPFPVLILQHDFVALQETHSTAGTVAAASAPEDTVPFWSHGTRHQAGVGLIVRKPFLQKFDPVRRDDWEEVIPGRLAALHLRGLQGNLSVVTAYFPSGLAQDARMAVRSQLREVLGRRPRSLWIILGDFNYVTKGEDRFCLDSGMFTGARDAAEQRHWREHVAARTGLREISQPSYTFQSTSSRSRLDRIYTNHHTADFFSSTFFAIALPWPVGVSDHRPLSIGRRRSPDAGRLPSLVDQHIRHPDFAKRVSREYHLRARERLAAGSGLDAIQRLRLVKDAMHSVGQAMGKTRQGHDYLGALTVEASAATAFRLVAGIEIGSIRSLKVLRAKLPSAWCASVAGRASTLRDALVALKGLAIDLTKDEVLRDMRAEQEATAECDDHERCTRKNSIGSRLARLGRSTQNTGIFAMQDPSGQVQTDTEQIAEMLQNHWRTVFQGRPIDEPKLEAWMRVAERAGAQRLTAPASSWRLRTKDVQRALRIAGNSRPGPDGVPYEAWRRLGPLGVHLLWSAGRYLECGLTPGVAEHDAFNESLLCCLPKQSMREDAAGRQIYEPHNTRPLTITNTDNRMIANGYRIRWEPIIAPGIIGSQRGFIHGRSMLKNTIEIEHAAMMYSLREDDAAIILFDFTAAFPSVSRQYLRAAATLAGFPLVALGVVDSLYHNTVAQLLLHGCLYGHVPLQAGIRQGCPLSPLLFALASDSLLRIIVRRHPTTTTRAFADDTAMTVTSWSREWRRIFKTFEAYRLVSNLALNMEKTVVIPLWEADIEQLQGITRADPASPQIRWERAGKYLGVFIGPGKGESSWAKPARKFQNRLEEWDWSALGLHAALSIYNTYVLSVLLFVAQLERPPASVLALEPLAVRKIAPGPGSWCSAADLHHGPDLGLSGKMRPLGATCSAAMLRVHSWEGHRDGGISWTRFRRELSEIRSGTDKQVRAVLWRQWYDRHYPSVVHDLASTAAATGVHVQAARAALSGVPVGPLSPAEERRFKRGTQGWFGKKLLAQTQYDPIQRLRNRTERWRLRGLPGRTSRRIHRNLARLRHLAPPRVRSAVISTIFNRWATSRRMQSAGGCARSCVLRCSPSAADSIEHYVRCRAMRDWMATRLRLQDASRELDWWVLATEHTDTDLRMVAVATYVLYRTVNHLRHQTRLDGDDHSAYTRKFMDQMLYEACRDDLQLRRCCRGLPAAPRQKRTAEDSGTGQRRTRRRC